MRHVRNIRTDATPEALCSVHGSHRKAGRMTMCADNYCPRHRPANYAENMARHAVDSLPAHITREMHFHTYGITR